jgi:signal transduction histidine kinase
MKQTACGSYNVSKWERWNEKLMVFVPWLLLAPSVVLSQLAPGQAWRDRAVTLGLVGLACGWVLVGHTLLPKHRRERTALVVVYFAGSLVLFVALMRQDLVFVLFAITGFFHAHQLKPWPLAVAGVFSTSVAINTMTMGFPTATIQSMGIYVGVIVVQTAAISAGVVLADKGMQQHQQREEMVARLEAALEENAGLHAQLLTQAREAGVLDERQRMAREIHDTLAQGLTGIIAQVQAAQRLWPHPDRARPHLDQTLSLARESLAEARRSVQALRPGELDEAQLPDALRDLAQRWAADRQVGLRFDVTGDRVPLSPAIEVALFRVAQEALTNVAKHANASRVGLTLSYLSDIVLLDIRDDGVGMNGKNGQGFGLNSMKQRIRGVGGAMEIESTPGEGTAVNASVPMITVSTR